MVRVIARTLAAATALACAGCRAGVQAAMAQAMGVAEEPIAPPPPPECLSSGAPGLRIGERAVAIGDECEVSQSELPKGFSLARYGEGPSTSLAIRREYLEWDAARVVCVGRRVAEIVVYDWSVAPSCLEPVLDNRLLLRWTAAVDEIFGTTPPTPTAGLVVSKKGFQLFLVPSDLRSGRLVPVLRITRFRDPSPPPDPSDEMSPPATTP